MTFSNHPQSSILLLCNIHSKNRQTGCHKLSLSSKRLPKRNVIFYGNRVTFSWIKIIDNGHFSKLHRDVCGDQRPGLSRHFYVKIHVFKSGFWLADSAYQQIRSHDRKSLLHYIDVIMTTMTSRITSLTVVYSNVYSDADQRKHQSFASLAFVRGIHRDRWIPRTKGQLRGKCFHLMTSSWITRMLTWIVH